MLPGQMMPRYMSQLASVKDGPKNLPLKFGQNQVSNNWDDAGLTLKDAYAWLCIILLDFVSLCISLFDSEWFSLTLSDF